MKVKNNLLVCLFTILFPFDMMADETNPCVVIQKWGQYLEQYSDTKDIVKYGPLLESICNGELKCRVEDDLMRRFAKENPLLPQVEGTYMFDSYINGISKLIDMDCKFSIENIEEVHDIARFSFAKGEPRYVKFDIVLSKGLKHITRYSDLAFVRNDRITGLYQYNVAKRYTQALSMLSPCLKDGYHGFYEELNDKNFKKAFRMFREIVAAGGDIARDALEFMVALEFAGVGCEDLDNYVVNFDISFYLRGHSSFPNIKKKSGCWVLDGYRVDKFVGKGEDTVKGKWLKKNPYYNNIGSSWFYYVASHYRVLACNHPYVKCQKGKWGYVDQYGALKIPYIYTFGYMFDPKTGLALVKNQSGKWGFINTKGNNVIPFNYDVANDIFVNGKNFVIKDNTLCLIDIKGNVLRQISGYDYLVPKLYEDMIFAYNINTKQYDTFDFNGNLLARNCTPKDFQGQPLISLLR